MANKDINYSGYTDEGKYVPLSEREGNSSNTNNGYTDSGEYIPLSDRAKDTKSTNSPNNHILPKSDYESATSQDISKVNSKVRSASSSVEFDAPAFDDFIVNHGMPSLWQQAFICPCIDPVTHAAKQDCPICHGTYRGYLPARKDTYVALQSQDRGTTKTKEFGNLDLGTARGTFKGDTAINILDRITIPNLYVKQNFVFTVTQDRFDSGFYIPYDVNKILYIVGYKDNSLHDLVEGYDYVYKSEEHKIHILNKGLIDTNVSLILNVVLRYIITDIIKDTRYQYLSANKITQHLPKEALLKRESILINNMPLVPKSDSDIEQDRNQALSKEGIRIMTTDKSSGFGLEDL